ncbi:MAG: lipopolysaccharide core heptose(I) kinase RfaP [Zoogloeaceae bacterium]|jgi:heptose I phosphotransferase|nr:lipopolysaccharide core heptose(I) kinase RfaP [Zoogloeaceae bacterium]
MTRMRIFLAEPFASLWRGKDPFAEVARLSGEVFRDLDGRSTFRIEQAGKGFFVKRHSGIGWREILKNWSKGKAPVLGARQEFAAIERLHALSVPTMTAVAFGERGRNPARQESFLITEELAPTVDLEVFTQRWPETPPPLALKRALIKTLAGLIGKMHAGGVNHRDCYLCHFLLRTDPLPTPEALGLSVIDLHRAQCRTVTPRRWRDKDLAALNFSAQAIGLTRRDVYRFLHAYFQQPLRRILAEEAASLSAIARKTERLIDRKRRYGDAL